MGGAGNRGKAREKTKGFPVMSHCLLGNNFRSHHNIPSTCPRLVCCTEIKCGKRSTEPHLRADRPRTGQKSGKEPGQASTCDNPHIACQSLRVGRLWVGWRHSVQVPLFFKLSKFYAVLSFYRRKSHSLNFQIKIFLLFFPSAL